MKTTRDLAQFLRSKQFIFLIVVLAVAAVVPALNPGTFPIYVLTLVTIFAIYASSWNLLAYSGQGSLGHAVFLGLGGFASALAAINFGVPPILSLFIGGAVSAGIGFLVGLTCVRLKAWFLAMVTFGFSVIAISLFSQFDYILHGNQGFPPPSLVPKPIPGSPNLNFYYLAIAFATGSIIVMYAILKSRVGLAFKAIKENDSEAKMTGINTTKYKLLAFVISTFFAGIAGGLYAYFIGYVNNSVFDAEYSFLPLIMAVIGGLGTIEGPIIGALILESIRDVLPLPGVTNFLQRTFGSYFTNVTNVGPYLIWLGIGIFLVLIVIFAPRGITSIAHGIYRRVRLKVKRRGKT
jgi:branched-chain amino acid transport system permease protein